MPRVLFITIAVLLILLALFGLIGPKWLRIRMRKFNTWAGRKGILLFPIDPYKPFGEAVRDSLKNPIPADKRTSYWVGYCFLVSVFYSLVAHHNKMNKLELE